MPNTTVSVRVDKTLLKDLDAQAQQEGRTRSNLISVLLRMALLARRKDRKES